MKVKSLLGKMLCFIGIHAFVCTLEDCIAEFGGLPSDNRFPKNAKCSRCGTLYGEPTHKES
jgi:hypothetical protein